jgi:predicted ribosome quality control (RQC) complex YloA/Tae2 family protein
MFHHAILIEKIALALSEKIKNWELAECYTQNKDELILTFVSPSAVDDLYIKADLRPQVSIVSFPSNLARAKKNSVDLFSEILNLKVDSILTFPMDRSFCIRLRGAYDIVFKLYGRRSNILLFKDDQLHQVFRSELKQDFELTKATFLNNASLLNQSIEKSARIIFTDKVMHYLESNDQCHDVNSARNHLLDLPTFVVDGPKPMISIFPSNDSNEKCFKNVLEAVNEFQKLFVNGSLLEQEKDKIKQKLLKLKKQTANYINKNESKVQQLKERRSYRELADIIMANLHQIKTGDTLVELHDFYQNDMVKIKLKPNLSPQLNAELLYRKAKNEKLEIDKLDKNLAAKKSILNDLDEKIASLDQIKNWKTLRIFDNQNQPTDNQASLLPYHTYIFQGYEIRIGKDARKNDQLTTRHAAKDDLWLHAKDVPGSHVVIRNPDKKKIPKPIIEYAAGLAAYYSKRKHDTLCPVLYTQRKYVRKSKKLAPGQVIVDKEDVILIEPLNPKA